MKILIDGDVILYLAVATAQEPTLDACRERFDKIVIDIAESHFATTDDCELYLSGYKNFRKVHYPSYKSNRGSKPEMIEVLKDALIKDESTIVCEGIEADDGLLIRAAELGEGNWSIATVDKDLRTHPGRCYNVRTQEHKVVTPAEAYTFMFQQFVMGDSVDGIKGLKGWGPKKTERLINDELGIWEAMEMAKEIWEVNHGDEDYKEAFNETCNLAFIRRRSEDCQPLEFWDMSESELRSVLRVCV